MPKPDPDQIIEDARKLQSDRFQKRDQMLKRRAAERFNQTVVDVPAAYTKTAHQHVSSVIEDEGQQIGTLVYAMPVPHVPAGVPEDQPLTTTEEKFLIAWHAELEAVFGPVWWQNTLAQVHDNIAWIYCGWRKVPYQGQPKAPADDADFAAVSEYGVQNDRFKRDAGVAAYCDYRYVPTSTVYCQGNIYNPDRVCEVKEVPERDFMQTYGVVRNRDGSFSKATEDPQTVPSGYPRDQASTETRVKVVEYWDRQWCIIVAEDTKPKWLGTRSVKGGFLLEEWEHGWGRVPYFARPARITDQLDEDKRFAGPLDHLYAEMPSHKMLRTMGYSVAYQTAFSPLQIVTKESGDQILDDAGTPVIFLDLEPGKARQMAPGQQIQTIPQSPEVANLFQEIAASQARIEYYSVSPVSKGVSPGADTANAALSNLHRFQLSTLDPMAQQAARQASAIYRFALERIKDMQERVYVLDEGADQYLSLDSNEIVSLNVQAKVTPDQGQFQLLIEKHAAELKQLGLITLQEMYEMWGKENPEEYVLELKAERLAEGLEPVINQQIISDLGMLDAVKAMIQANAQQGSARGAVPGLMGQVGEMNQTGTGQGAGGQPRTNGVRSPVVSETTQPTEPSVPAPQPGGY